MSEHDNTTDTEAPDEWEPTPDELLDISDAREFPSCPHCDDPAKPDHNSRTTSDVKPEMDEDGTVTLTLWLHMKCSCGFEQERTIG